MMKSALLNLAAVCVGMIAAFLLLAGIELLSAVVHPLPPGFGGTQEEMCLHVANYPQWVLGAVVPLWALTAFIGTAIARWIGSFYSALFVGLLLFAGLVLNISMLPYPLWFKAANLVAVPIAVYFGSRMTRRQKTADAALAG
jgi:hypothetical protein